jgi:hypothetical protein
MNQTITLPFYAKLTFILLSLICIGFITYIGSDIITPVMLAFLFTVLLFAATFSITYKNYASLFILLHLQL